MKLELKMKHGLNPPCETWVDPCESDNKIGLEIDLNPFFLAKTKCILIHLESIMMDFIKSRKSL